MKIPRTNGANDSSFRDPAGFLFWKDGQLYRQVNKVYQENYDHLIASGFYKSLLDEGLIIQHEEVEAAPFFPALAYCVIRPEMLSFISYPYEWCFSQLKDAALLTLKIQMKAMEYGMSLKDCSAYNIQFRKGRPVLIDTLSFEKYREGQPWVAYRQFCQHFLGPLAIMNKRDVRLNQLLRIYIDGVPLDLASKLLPLSTRFSFSLLTHIHLHAVSQQKYAGRAIDLKGRKMSRLAFIGIVDSLVSAVQSLHWKPLDTEWADYYNDTNYTRAAFQHKNEIISGFLDILKPSDVWDLGANIGTFSKLAADKGIPTVACDIDPAAIEINYRDCVIRGEKLILPLIIDLTNPSGNIGWENMERASFIERGKADTVFALALLHHLAISNNVPLSRIARFMGRICNRLIIEFVPKEDSQVMRLLATREDVFTTYTQQNFEDEFSGLFDIIERTPIKESKRTLYLMMIK